MSAIFREKSESRKSTMFLSAMPILLTTIKLSPIIRLRKILHKMGKLTTKQRLLLIGLLFIEAMTMFWIVPKANADVIDVQVWLINRHILSFSYKPGSLKKE